MAYVLYIGNKNYSSWSLRAWLMLRAPGIAFTERIVSLRPDAGKAERLARFPNRRVPCLEDDGFPVWDTMSIAEYLAERHPGLWPDDPKARAWARSICAEMHSGFGALRDQMSMDIRSRRPQRKRSPEVLADIGRIEDIWIETRHRYGGSGALLFGAFTIADAFYAPVACRFRTYAVAVQGEAGEYMRNLLALPAVREWEAAAADDEALADHDLDQLYPDD